jgi:radical SAM superfamily enzyme YgiQ (UPF0313 family)
VPQYPGRRRWIGRSVGSVLAELEFLVRDRGVHCVFFTDPSFGHSRERVEALCDGILSRGLDLLWGCEMRCNEVQPGLPRRMARAGCVFVGLGIETGTEETLREIRKQISLRDIEASTRELADADLEVQGNMIVGFPWDDRAHVGQCLDFYTRLPIDIFGVNFAVPFHGTPLYTMAVEEGLVFDWDYARWTTTLPVMRTRHMDREALDTLYRRITRAFYLRPAYFRHVLMRIRRRPRRILDYAALTGSVLQMLRFGGTHRRSG